MPVNYTYTLLAGSFLLLKVACPPFHQECIAKNTIHRQVNRKSDPRPSDLVGNQAHILRGSASTVG